MTDNRRNSPEEHGLDPVVFREQKLFEKGVFHGLTRAIEIVEARKAEHNKTFQYAKTKGDSCLQSVACAMEDDQIVWELKRERDGEEVQREHD